jgi:hypothetical protein
MQINALKKECFVNKYNQIVNNSYEKEVCFLKTKPVGALHHFGVFCKNITI